MTMICKSYSFNQLISFGFAYGPRSMCDRAFEWAKRQGLWQVNPIHGEEEASLVIERLFSTEEQEGEAFSQSGSFATEA